MSFNSANLAMTATLTLACLAGPRLSVQAGTPASAVAMTQPRRSPERFRVNEALLALKVRARLLEEIRDDALSIGVEARGQAIILTGEVKQQASLGRAETVARSVDGVTQVNSKLTNPRGEDAPRAVSFVTLDNGHALADALLETRIRRILLARYGGGVMKIAVEAYDGVVSLSGSVPTGAQRDQAMRAARASRGVRLVRDLMSVGPRPADDSG